MEKIIGRGVLLLKIAPSGPWTKFGYQLSSDGVQLFSLGGGSAPPTTGSVTGTGYLMLNDLPASPNDAFYGVTFNGTNIGAPTESFSLQVQENGAFGHGPQHHFSGLNFTFKYNKTDRLTIDPGGSVKLHLDKGVFVKAKTLDLKPEWNQENKTLIFNGPATKVKMDSIGELSKFRIELGTSYDRWDQLKALYTFEGGLAPDPENDPVNQLEIGTHDISGQGAPSLFFDGDDNFVAKNNKTFGASWTKTGIAFASTNAPGILYTPENIHNPVVSSIQVSEDFSVEIWIKPESALQEGPAQIFSIESMPAKAPNSYFFLGHGPWLEGKHKKNAVEPAGAYLSANYGPPLSSFTPVFPPYWEKPFKSPANSLGTDLMHVVYTYNQQAGTQQIFINGVQVAQKFDPSGFYSNWEGDLRIAVGNSLKADNKDKPQPWKGEIQQLAIFNRALSAAEVQLHYQPAISITGAFSLDNVIPPLTGEVFPFNLSISQEAASLIAAREVELDINQGLGFRHVYLECSKLPDSPWSFAGKFQTRFWEDIVPLQARFETSGGTTALELSSGAQQELGVIPLVLENAMPGYRELRLRSPRLVLTEPIRLNGKWMNEDMAFISDPHYTWVWDKEDYYLEIGVAQPKIHLKASVASKDSINSILPDLFDPNEARPNSTDAITIIKNAENKFCLQLNVTSLDEAGVRAAYEAFFKKPEIKGLSNAGIDLLKRRIAERLPLNYDQILYYHYGWDVKKGYIDLQAGMRLRIDLQNYQFVQASDETARRGFVGSGSFYIPVNSYVFLQEDGTPAQKLGFGPFLSNVQTNGKTEIHKVGAGGPVDLLKTGNQKAFYRLFYPKQLAEGPDTERVVTFLGADSYSALEAATERFASGNFDATDDASSFFFRGKAMVIPEIQVYVSDKPIYVSVGTTLRQLIEMFDDVPGAGLQQNLNVFAGKSRPLRRIHDGANSQPEYRFIDFPDTAASNNNTDVLDLPLIKGDRFYF